jgi:hypothetical protein
MAGSNGPAKIRRCLVNHTASSSNREAVETACCLSVRMAHGRSRGNELAGPFLANMGTIPGSWMTTMMLPDAMLHTRHWRSSRSSNCYRNSFVHGGSGRHWRRWCRRRRARAIASRCPCHASSTPHIHIPCRMLRNGHIADAICRT